jgi:hypothetical protein
MTTEFFNNPLLPILNINHYYIFCARSNIIYVVVKYFIQTRLLDINFVSLKCIIYNILPTCIKI